MKSAAPPTGPGPIGDYLGAWEGHATDVHIRAHAASGGVVSAVLIHLLERGTIDAALVCSSSFEAGRLDHRIHLARTRGEILEARSSKYFDIPVLNGLASVRESGLRTAVVALPSQLRSLTMRTAKDPDLAALVRFKIALFCGHNSQDQLIREVWRREGVEEAAIQSFYFRQGHWRGRMEILFKDGSRRSLPFQKFSHFQNLHILSLRRCLNCYDHMGFYADLSCGDVWRMEMKREEVKHSLFLARTPVAAACVNDMLENGLLKARPVDRRTVYRSQMRSINYHYTISARARLGRWFGLPVKEQIRTPVRWRDLAAAAIVLANHRVSDHPALLRMFMRLPLWIVAFYLYLFKALTHYERDDY